MTSVKIPAKITEMVERVNPEVCDVVMRAGVYVLRLRYPDGGGQLLYAQAIQNKPEKLVKILREWLGSHLGILPEA